MGRHSASQIVRRTDVDVAIARFEEVDVHTWLQSRCAPMELREAPFALPAFGWPATSDDDEHYCFAVAL